MTVIRTETHEDYRAIAEIHARAFTHSHTMGEVLLVDVHRHGAGYDPSLSLVAESDGRVVGHVLFTPHRVQLNGAMVSGVILSPIAVHPHFQSQGIGGQLIEEGHRRAAAQGYAFSMLLGHPEYYPRFGYRTGMYGTCRTDVQRGDVPDLPGAAPLTERRVGPSDLPLLQSIWQTWHEDVDLAIRPGDLLIDWISTDKGTKSVVVVDEDSQVVGYLRYSADRPQQPTVFLASDESCTRRLLAYVNTLVSSTDVETISLPVHPMCPAARRLLPIPATPRLQSWKAGMIKILDPKNAQIRCYCDEVERGAHPIGLVIWPVEYDVCD